ncbi:ImmA/IrrE family metallo-endopeptidase [Myxococcus stipitatus]|nr:ImmA/IrrE family metallo-endopeptidase [Myxococcus stipitatus]
MLTTDGVRDWLGWRDFEYHEDEAPRRLHGCMVANAGGAVLLMDSEDSLEEQRFTLAHEVAHFVLDHLVPRDWALRMFGESIRPVLDGLRDPTPHELISSHFSRVPIGVQVKLMDRNQTGTIQSAKVLQAERRADRLAFEFLAPAALAMETLSQHSEDDGVEALATRFGLTRRAAHEYARMLVRPRRPERFSLVRMLGTDGRGQ